MRKNEQKAINNLIIYYFLKEVLEMASVFTDTQLCGKETGKRSNNPVFFVLFRLQIVVFDAKIPFLCRL
jgi:hypothetical protein